MHVHFNRLKKLQFHFKDRVNFKRVEVIRVKTKYVLSCPAYLKFHELRSQISTLKKDPRVNIKR